MPTSINSKVVFLFSPKSVLYFESHLGLDYRNDTIHNIFQAENNGKGPTPEQTRHNLLTSMNLDGLYWKSFAQFIDTKISGISLHFNGDST